MDKYYASTTEMIKKTAETFDMLKHEFELSILHFSVFCVLSLTTRFCRTKAK
jgi:hypothetical protein